MCFLQCWPYFVPLSAEMLLMRRQGLRDKGWRMKRQAKGRWGEGDANKRTSALECTIIRCPVIPIVVAAFLLPSLGLPSPVEGSTISRPSSSPAREEGGAQRILIDSLYSLSFLCSCHSLILSVRCALSPLHDWLCKRATTTQNTCHIVRVSHASHIHCHPTRWQ